MLCCWIHSHAYSVSVCPSIVSVLPSDAAYIFLSLPIGAMQDDAPLLDMFRLSSLYVFFLLTDKKEDIAIPPAVVMPTPSKRGRKSKQVMGRVSGVPPPGSDALILAHLTAGGQVRLANIFCVFVYVRVCLYMHILYIQRVTVILLLSSSITPLTRMIYQTMRTITQIKMAPNPTGSRRLDCFHIFMFSQHFIRQKKCANLNSTMKWKPALFISMNVWCMLIFMCFHSSYVFMSPGWNHSLYTLKTVVYTSFIKFVPILSFS